MKLIACMLVAFMVTLAGIITMASYMWITSSRIQVTSLTELTYDVLIAMVALILTVVAWLKLREIYTG